MIVKMAGRVRGFFAGNYPENREEEQIVMNPRGDLAVAQSLPELTELVRLGDSWQVSLASGLAALTALPTTVAGISLYNGEPATGKCYAIDSFGSVEEVIDATQADTTALFAMMNTLPLQITTPTGTALTVRGLSGKVYGGNAKVTTTLTVTNEGWFPHGPQAPLAPAVAGANWKVNECQVRGMYLVRPGGMFNVQAVKAAAAAAAQQFFYVRWHEVQIIAKT